MGLFVWETNQRPAARIGGDRAHWEEESCGWNADPPRVSSLVDIASSRCYPEAGKRGPAMADTCPSCHYANPESVTFCGCTSVQVTDQELAPEYVVLPC